MKLRFWEKEEPPKEPEYLSVEFVMNVLIGKLYQFTSEEMAAEVIKLKNKLNLVLRGAGLGIATTDEDIRESVEELLISFISNEALEPVVVRDTKDKEGRYKEIRFWARDYLRGAPELKPTIDTVLAEVGLPIQTDDLMPEQMSERRG